MKHLGDITKLNGSDVEAVDCVCFGSPCQDLSASGLRKGLAGERSGLFMEAIRIIKEIRNNGSQMGKTSDNIRPRFAIWENVCGAMYSNDADDFRKVLEEFCRIGGGGSISIPKPTNGWRDAGLINGDNFSVAWRVVNARNWGRSEQPTPQIRRRLAVVADFGGQSAGEILFKCESLSRNITKDGAERGHDSEPHYENNGEGGAWVVDEKNSNTYVFHEMANTLAARDCKQPQNIIKDSKIRRITPLECERLQGYPDNWTNIPNMEINGKLVKCSDSARYKALGNSICTPFWTDLLGAVTEELKKNNPSKQYTMASLFDGIGGFPLGWEKHNGKGSARWASEIEPFPIAVTTYHFGEEKNDRIRD